MNELSGEVTELKRSLEYSQQEIDELKRTVRDLKEVHEGDRREIARLQTTNDDLYDRTNDLHERANDLDDGNRRNNLRIDGLDETTWETGEQSFVKVQAFLKDNLDMEDVPLDNAHRVGQPRDRRPRTILVRFSRQADRDATLRNARKLRGSIYVYEDLCPESQRIKREKYDDYRKAKSEGKIAFFRGSRLVIRPRHSNTEDSAHSQPNPTPHIPPSSTISPGADSRPSTTTSPANASSPANPVSPNLPHDALSTSDPTNPSPSANSSTSAGSYDTDAAQPLENAATINDNNNQQDKRRLRDRK